MAKQSLENYRMKIDYKNITINNELPSWGKIIKS